MGWKTWEQVRRLQMVARRAAGWKTMMMMSNKKHRQEKQLMHIRAGNKELWEIQTEPKHQRKVPRGPHPSAVHQALSHLVETKIRFPVKLCIFSAEETQTDDESAVSDENKRPN